jgi:branched-chain amino acid transport system permease protein
MARFEGRTRSALLAVLCVAFLAIAPRFIGLFAMSTVSDIFMVATIAFALNLIAGYAGCPAFGNVVFFGIGAYATGLVMVRYEGPFALGLAVAAAACAVTALLAGPPLLRLRGHYFAIGTLGLNGAAAQLVTNLPISGGARGLSLPLAAGTPHAVATFFYEAFLATLVVAVVAGYALTRGPLGYDLKAIRSGDDVAGSLGVDTLGVKVRVWVVSAIFTGIAGGVYAYSLTYIEPPDVFSLALSVKAFVIMLLGGTATILGPLIAAVVVESAIAFTQHVLLNYDVGMLGLIIMAIVLLFPQGVTAFVRQHRRRRAVERRR